MEESWNQPKDTHMSDNDVNGSERRPRARVQCPEPHSSSNPSAECTMDDDLDLNDFQEGSGTEGRAEGEEDFITPQAFHRLTNQITRELATLNEEVTNMTVRCQLLETDLVVQLTPYMTSAVEEAEETVRESQEVIWRVANQNGPAE